MNSFTPNYISQLKIEPGTTWLIGSCMEARGMQALWEHTKPEVLAGLREMAIIQSAESSNRIEGVEVEPRRLRPLLQGKVAPQDRCEEEVLGYREALELIFSNFSALEITPETVQRLHKISLGDFSGDAGQWKQRNNEIIEILPSGERVIRFVPVVPELTQSAMQQLCLGYKDVMEKRQLPDLVAVELFTLDFLCIHPFRDGNGRVSRLLTLLLLLQSGYELGRYISIERLIEASKVRYYETLKASSVGWHEGAHNITPFLNFICAILKQGYAELSDRVKIFHDSSRVLSEIVKQAILQQDKSFTLRDLQKACPSASQQLIKKVLYQMKGAGQAKLTGRGKGARWRVERDGELKVL